MAISHPSTTRAARRSNPHQFSILLLAWFLFLAIYPFFQVFSDSFGALVFYFLMSLILVANIYATSHRVASLIAGGTLFVTFAILSVYSHLSGNQSVETYIYLLVGFMWVYSSGSILAHILSDRDVTIDMISGSVCVYLQLGLIWAIAFYFIETLIPGSFNVSTVPLTSTESSRTDFSLFIYYSFVTLTTLGFGDILPLSHPAKAFTYLEAAVGQVYLAVLVARLLGLNLARRD